MQFPRKEKNRDHGLEPRENLAKKLAGQGLETAEAREGVLYRKVQCQLFMLHKKNGGLHGWTVQRGSG